MSGIVAGTGETDEQFARRLQQQEMVTRAGGDEFGRNRAYQNPHVPLLNSSSHHGAGAMVMRLGTVLKQWRGKWRRGWKR